MKIYTEHFPAIGKPFDLCIGKFDGVHAGHRRILDTLLDVARGRAAEPVVYSFEPRSGTPQLTTREEKLALFEQHGIASVVLVEFTEELMATEAEPFIGKLAGCGELHAVVVGEDFRFGRGASGDAVLLKALGARFGFDVHVAGQVCMDGLPVSSTRIRECIRAGNMAASERLLGREYSLTGQVITGRQLGRRLGYPTTNILPPPGKLIPANGVYACLAELGGMAWPAMTNVGCKPTVDGRELLIESHLAGYQGDAYGDALTLRFIRKIRDERKFEGLGALKEQLAEDLATARAILAGRK